MADLQPNIRNLGILGDQRTAALIGHDGTIVWYCPKRFDSPALFGCLLDKDIGGFWTIEHAQAIQANRAYLGASAILETRVRLEQAELTLTDWMPVGEDVPEGICRCLSACSRPVTMLIDPRPVYGKGVASVQLAGRSATINADYSIHASHPLELGGGRVWLEIPANEEGWVVLLGNPAPVPSKSEVARWLQATLE